jgi:hypothetical protein
MILIIQMKSGTVFSGKVAEGTTVMKLVESLSTFLVIKNIVAIYLNGRKLHIKLQSRGMV